MPASREALRQLGVFRARPHDRGARIDALDDGGGTCFCERSTSAGSNDEP